MSSSNVTIGKLKLFGQLNNNEETFVINNLHYTVAVWTVEEWKTLIHKPPGVKQVGNVMVQLTAN